MPSTLGFAILGVLAREPATGYEIAARMRSPIGFFWTAQHSQIYAELAKLTNEQYAADEVIDGPGPRPTRRYTITAAGRAELRRWATQLPAPQPQRDLFTLRVYSLWVADRDAAIELVQQQREAHAQRLNEYEQSRRNYEDDSGFAYDPSTPAFSSYATLRAGIGYERHRLTYCDWLLDCLRME